MSHLKFDKKSGNICQRLLIPVFLFLIPFNLHPALATTMNCSIGSGRWYPELEYNRYTYTYKECNHDRRQHCLKKRSWNAYRWVMDGCEDWRISPEEVNRCFQSRPVYFIGDSLTRNMFESLVCMQTSANEKVVVTSKFKLIYMPFRSVFRGKKKGRKIHRIDLSVPSIMDPSFLEMKEDILQNFTVVVLGFGHHFNPYFLETVNPKINEDRLRGFEAGVESWLRAFSEIGYTGKVLWLPYIPSHFTGGEWNQGGDCHRYSHPSSVPMRMSQAGHLAEDWNFRLRKALATARQPLHAEYFNIEYMTDLRPDAHPGRSAFVKINEKSQDCVHYCLPGVPDSWNEMLAYHLGC